MDSIIEVLMTRDRMTLSEATNRLEEVKEMIDEDFCNAEELLMQELGIELDYIMELI